MADYQVLLTAGVGGFEADPGVSTTSWLRIRSSVYTWPWIFTWVSIVQRVRRRMSCIIRLILYNYTRFPRFIQYWQANETLQLKMAVDLLAHFPKW